MMEEQKQEIISKVVEELLNSRLEEDDFGHGYEMFITSDAVNHQTQQLLQERISGYIDEHIEELLNKNIELIDKVLPEVLPKVLWNVLYFQSSSMINRLQNNTESFVTAQIADVLRSEMKY